jgi:leader peptidase (prepilin peptidase)/N-methyltransferase
MLWFYYLVAAGFGLIFGSFFNVCAYRLPMGKTLGDRSACPECDGAIKWYDNVPLLSFVLLRGKCRRCGARISWRYPLVELSTSLLFVLVYWWSIKVVPSLMSVPAGKGFYPELFVGLLMVSVLVIATTADYCYGLIPNKATYPGMVMMLGLVIGLALYRGQPGRIGLSVAGGAIGGGFMLTAGLVYGVIFMRKRGPDKEEEDGERAPGSEAAGDGDSEERNHELPTGSGSTWDGEEEAPDDEFQTGVGMGDVKLMLFVGLAVGNFHWYLILVALFFGYLIGSVVSVALIALGRADRKTKLPFAPYLAAGSVIALVWGSQIINQYLNIFR